MPEGRLSRVELEAIQQKFRLERVRNVVGNMVNIPDYLETDFENIDGTDTSSSLTLHTDFPPMQDELRYIETVDLYGRVLKNATFLGLDEKVAHIDNFLDKWNRIITTSIFDVDRWLETSVQQEDLGLTEFSGEQKNRVRFGLKIMTALMASQMMSQELASYELETALDNITDDVNRQNINQLWSAFILLDINKLKNDIVWRRLIMHYRRNRYFLTLMIHRLWMHYITTKTSLRDQDRAANLIADLSISLGGTVTQKTKQGILEEIRNAKRRTVLANRLQPEGPLVLDRWEPSFPDR
jgi:hypothetical protein